MALICWLAPDFLLEDMNCGVDIFAATAKNAGEIVFSLMIV